MPNLADFTQLVVAASGFFCAYRTVRPLKWIASDVAYAKTELEVFAVQPDSAHHDGIDSFHYVNMRHQATASLAFVGRVRAFTLAAAPCAVIGSCLVPFGLLAPLAGDGALACAQIATSLLALGSACTQMLLAHYPLTGNNYWGRDSFHCASRALLFMQMNLPSDPVDTLTLKAHQLAAARMLGSEIAEGTYCPLTPARKSARL